MRWMIVSPALLLLAISCNGASDEQHAEIDQIVRSHHDGTTALSVAVVRNGDIVYSGAFGFEDPAGSIAASGESRFNIASVTKPITSVAVMQLVERGLLDLDDKLIEILDDVPSSWNDITIRQMLAHTSGILDYARHPDGRQLVVSDHILSESRSEILSWDLEFEAGTDWAYSNSAYHLLGHVVSKKSGLPFGEYLRANIFDPAGMSSAFLDTPETAVSHRVVGLEAGSDPAQIINPNGSFGAGGVVCTATDLAKFDIALYSGKLLAFDLLKTAQTPRGGNKPAGIFGLGWIINEKDGATYIGHVGGKPGFDSFYLRNPKADYSVIVLRARTGGSATKIAEAVMVALMEELILTWLPYSLAPFFEKYE